MDLSGLKWPLIIAVVVGIGWLATSGGVNWMYGKFTAASPGVDEQQDYKDEAGLTKLAGYTYHLERLATCYERTGDYQSSYNVLRELMAANAHEMDSRVGNFDNLNMRAAKLREMYELP